MQPSEIHMEYRIEIEEHSGHKVIHTYIKGVVLPEERDRVGKSVIQLMEDKNITRSLWDVREAHMGYSLTNVHVSAENVEEYNFKAEHSVAIIYQHNQEEYKHAQNVTYNRGFTNIAFFQSLEEGIQWLINRG